MPVIILVIAALVGAGVLLGIMLLADEAASPVKGWLWGLFAVALIAWAVGFGAGSRYVVIRYAKANCAAWGAQTEREVRFIQPSTWDWGCYVHTSDGWVERGQIRKLEP